MHTGTRWFGVSVLAMLGCAGAHSPLEGAARGPAPFEYVGESWLRVPVRLGDALDTHVVFDTGGGITLLSSRVCQRVHCVPDGTYTGERMSGQAIQVPMARLSSITVAGRRFANVRVAVLDTPALVHPELGVDGFIALDLFRDQALTIDYPALRVVVEHEASLRARRQAGASVAVHVEHDGPSTVVYLPMDVAGGTTPLYMEVDSGSQDLVLDERFMAPLQIDPLGTGVRRVEGQDETGHAFVRFFATLPRAVTVHGAPGVEAPARSIVMFQRIIHDGLAGENFLRAYAVTFDLPHGTMIFGRPAGAPAP